MSVPCPTWVQLESNTSSTCCRSTTYSYLQSAALLQPVTYTLLTIECCRYNSVVAICCRKQFHETYKKLYYYKRQNHQTISNYQHLIGDITGSKTIFSPLLSRNLPSKWFTNVSSTELEHLPNSHVAQNTNSAASE